jgi:hypothetical protein
MGNDKGGDTGSSPHFSPPFSAIAPKRRTAETSDRNAASRCIALLRSAGPPHIHVRIATNGGEKCGLGAE